ARGAVAFATAALPPDARGFALGGEDGAVLAFLTVLSVASGLLFGLVPAASASRVDLAGAMKAGGVRTTGTGGARLRGTFIAAEVGLAVVLAVGAGLLVRTLWSLLQVDPGFRPERTLTLRVTPTPPPCGGREAWVGLTGAPLRGGGAGGGVGAVAGATALPLSGGEPLLPVELEGHPLVPGDPAPLVWAGAVTPSYFPILR